MALLKPRKRVQTSIAELIHDHLREIKEQFGEKAKLTLIIRSERLEQPIIFTNDEPGAAIAAIKVHAEKGAGPGLVKVGE
jgi:hypothetical protein